MYLRNLWFRVVGKKYYSNEKLYAQKVRCLNEIASEKTEKQEAKQKVPPGIVQEEPKPKEVAPIIIKFINTETIWQLENSEDVKKYLAKLEKKLMNQLEKDTMVNIEF